MKTKKIRAWAIVCREDNFLIEVKKYYKKPTVKYFFPMFNPRGKYRVVPVTITYSSPIIKRKKK